MTGYLTPDSIPVDTICRVLFIPNNQEFLANVTGALQTLTLPENWFPQGALTPQQSADALVSMFDMFCFNQGACRVIGEIILFGNAVSPDVRWLPCDGASYLRSDYPDLYAVILDQFGSIDSAHFNVPDMRSRVPVGSGTGTGLSPYLVGDAVGHENVTLTTAQMPAHTHIDGGHAHSIPSFLLTGTAVPPPFDGGTEVPLSLASSGVGVAAIQNTGGGGDHPNIQPVLAVAYYIVAKS